VIESTVEDPEVISSKILCDGKLCPAGHSIPECFDMFFKFFWVFSLEYPLGLTLFFQFLENKMFKLPPGKKTVSSSLMCYHTPSDLNNRLCT
jgi:hypothetical protein